MTGLRAWVMQRASAVYMLGFVPFALLHWQLDPPQSYEAWRLWVSSSGMVVAIAVFFAALLLHAWVGLRDVLLDYLPSTALRVVALGAVAVALLVTATWILAILGRTVLS